MASPDPPQLSGARLQGTGRATRIDGAPPITARRSRRAVSAQPYGSPLKITVWAIMFSSPFRKAVSSALRAALVTCGKNSASV